MHCRSARDTAACNLALSMRYCVPILLPTACLLSSTMEEPRTFNVGGKMPPLKCEIYHV